ncbi:MAG: arylsulfotransferase family protein [Egibacteraceae bacterium]
MEVKIRHDAASDRHHDDSLRGYLFSPASCYPIPVAYVVDSGGAILHRWSHPADQPRPEDDPPSYLRGWNHVEVDTSGNPFAIVPLRSVLKLTPSSALVWSCDIAAHHDLAIDDDGTILVLTEAPRRVGSGGVDHVVLDNLVAVVDPAGTMRTEISLYDVLCTNPSLRRLIDNSIRQRSSQFRSRGWPTPDDDVPLAIAQETLALLEITSYHGERRRALQRLRALPGSPCDVLHTNTLELLDPHPSGIWDRGDVLLCMREFNTISVVDLSSAEVRWWWGADELSGPHQPSMLPDGRILVFDNGRDMRRTRLIAVEPRTGQVVWSWSAQPPQSFFCPLAGGCERLPNGNLLVTNSTAGAAFQLTMDGRVVWQLTLPVEVYGADRGRVSIYRMSAVEPDVLIRLLSTVPAVQSQPTGREPAETGLITPGD